MKYNLLTSLIFCLFMPIVALCQYGDEWVEDDLTYLKIPVVEDGLWSISMAAIKNAGLPTDQISSAEYRMFKNGKEIPIQVKTDAIWFYGTGNDGKLDSALYTSAKNQPHTFRSFYNDTSYYFLTYTRGSTGLRYTNYRNTDISGLDEVPYHIRSQVKVFPEERSNTTFYEGERPSFAQVHPDMYSGEGFYSLSISRRGSSYEDAVFSTEDYKSGVGLEPTYETSAIGTRGPRTVYTNDQGEVFDVQLRLTYFAGNNKEVDWFNAFSRGYEEQTFKVPFPAQALVNDEVTIRSNIFRDAPQGGRIWGQLAISHAKLTYPASFNMLGEKYRTFHFTKASAERYIRLTNLPSGNYLVYDINNARSHSIVEDNGDIIVVIPPSSKDHLLVVCQDANMKLATAKKASFPSFVAPEGLDYLIVSSRQLQLSAEKYLAYRNSPEGGGHNGMLVYTEDLYNRHYYGQHHPMAIRNFLKKLVDVGNIPTNVFLLGKGLSIPALYANGPIPELDKNLVPTIGHPVSDWYYASYLKEGDFMPPFGIGRLSARNNNEVETYLEKVKVYESLDAALWRKNVLHLGGGADESEQAKFQNYLDNYAHLIEQPNFGGRTFFLGKSTSSTIENVGESIVGRINNGVSLLSYFGHAAGNIPELDFGQPSDYNNAGKPMVMYFSGCSIGYCFDQQVFLGESYLTARTGAVNWIAPSYLSLEPQINAFSYEWYEQLSKESYGKSLGEVTLATIQNFTRVGNIDSETQSLLNILQGDPANHIFNPDKPDYLIQENDVFITPEGATAQNDSFYINFTIRNQGKAIEDSFNCHLKVSYPDNATTIDTTLLLPPVANNQVFQYAVDNSQRNQFGTFTITVSIDPLDSIDELNEGNNKITFQYNMVSNGATGIYPLQYGIVASNAIELKAQGLDPNLQKNRFEFEIDTAPSFKSPWRKRSGTLNRGYVARWKVVLLPIDTLDYYWRVRLRLSENETTAWKTFTFSKVAGAGTGWAQVDFDQRETVELLEMETDTAKRRLRFGKKAPKSYRVYQHGRELPIGVTYNYGDNLPVQDQKGTRFPYDQGFGFYEINDRLKYNGIFAYAVDPYEFNGYVPNIGVRQEYGEFMFEWMTGSTTYNADVVDSFVKYLRSIPENYYLFIFTGYYHHIASMRDERVYRELEKFGSQYIRDISNSAAWGMIGQKGSPIGSAVENYTESIDGFFVLEKVIGLSKSKGSLRSTVIGPAQKWRSAALNIRAKSIENASTYHFNIYGVDINGSPNLLAENITANSVDLSFIDANSYPYIQLEMVTENAQTYKPVQLKSWVVEFDELPDGMLNPELAFRYQSDTLSQAEPLQFEIAYQNESNSILPSLPAQYEVLDKNRNVIISEVVQIKQLNPGESVTLQKTVSTRDLSGLHYFKLRTNPNHEVGEMHYFNNNFDRSFFVAVDNIKPNLQVHFDGKRIFQGDIISPSAVLTISGKDNNPFFNLDSAGYFTIQLQKEGETLPKKLQPDSQAHIKFIPSEEPGQAAYFIYSPPVWEPGNYTLYAQLVDVAGNQAGATAYQVDFTVVEETSISKFHAYPNPFANETHFAFTISGNALPDELKLQFYHMNGALAYEIDVMDESDIHIGYNLGNVTWRGTDLNGNLLPGGMYLYKVIARKDGEDMVVRPFSGESVGITDTSFREGYGKLVIMR